MLGSELKVYAERQPFYVGGTIGIHVLDLVAKTCAINVTMEPHNPGQFSPPLFNISENAAQELMDQLWSCGLRPSQGSGSAGSLSATQYHLEDMRKLVFKDQKND
jgi:hypothetical protein